MFVNRVLAELLSGLLLLLTQAGAASAEATVDIPDPGFRRCLTDALRVSSDADLTAAALSTITRLGCSGGYSDGRPEVRDVRGIQHLTAVTSVTLASSPIVDVSEVARLSTLRTLNLIAVKVSDLSALAGLKLESLGVVDLPLTDATFLNELGGLRQLALSGMDVDPSPISSLTNLTQLQVGTRTTRPDYSFIGRLPSLTTLDLMAETQSRFGPIGTPPALTSLRVHGDSLTDLGFLGEQSGLTRLTLFTGGVRQLPSLSGLTRLRQIEIWGSKLGSRDLLTGLDGLEKLLINESALTDADALVGLRGLTEVTLANGKLTRLPSLASLRNLTVLNVPSNRLTTLPNVSTLKLLHALDVSDNELTTLSRVTDLPELTHLGASSNELVSLGTLAGLDHLEAIGLYGNDLTSADALAGLPALKYVDARINQLTDVKAWWGLPHLTGVSLYDNRIADVSGFGSPVLVDAPNQIVNVKAKATVGVAARIPVRGIGGATPSLSVDKGTSVKGGTITYSKPGTHSVTFSQTNGSSTFSGAFNQKAGPDAEWRKTQQAVLVHVVPAVNSDLVVDMRSWTPQEDDRRYQWYRDGKAIPGATEYRYRLVAADLGHRLKASVTVMKDGYRTTTVWTSQSAKVIKGSFHGDPPTISGRAKTGQRLTSSLHWSPSPRNCAYQWRRDNRPISKATKATYRLTASDLGKRVDLVVRCDAPGIERQTGQSKRTAKLTQGPVRASTPSVTGSARVGRTVKVSKGSWGPGTISFTYRWLRDGKPISKARSSYTLTKSDAGHTISIRLTGDRPSYTAVTRTSAAVTVS